MYNEEKNLFKELELLKHEHQGLDKELLELGLSDQLAIQRFKKRKLWLKDRISVIEAELYPDIIA